MDRELFYTRLSEILEVSPEQFTAGGRRLPDEPDSVVLLEIMALVDEMTGVTLSPDAFKGTKSADDIVELVASSTVQ
jgi:acyl carrier protein